MNAVDYSAVIVAELAAVLSRVAPEEADRFADALLSARRIFVAGAGRSGFAARAFAMRLMHFGLDAHVVGETTAPNYEAEDLLVVCSGSGETGSLVAIADKARRIGGRLALLTIVPDSSIGRLADLTVRFAAPSPKAKAGDTVATVQPMGSLFEQSILLFLDATVLVLMARKANDTDRMFKRHATLE